MKIGQGSYYSIYKVKNKVTSEIVAMRVLVKQKYIESDFNLTNEIEMTKLVDHPFIVKSDYIFQDLSRVYQINEFMEYGDMFTHLRANKNLPEETVKFIAA